MAVPLLLFHFLLLFSSMNTKCCHAELGNLHSSFPDTHVQCLCDVHYERKGWFGSRGEEGMGWDVWQEKPSNRISVWKCAQYPTGRLSTLSKQDNLTSHSNVLWRLDTIFSMHVTQAAEKRKHYLLTCRARLYARVLALVLVSNGREFCSVSGLKKEGTCQSLTAKSYILCEAVGCRWMEFSVQLTSMRCTLGGKMGKFLLTSTVAMPFVRHCLTPNMLFNPLTEPREKSCVFSLLPLCSCWINH